MEKTRTSASDEEKDEKVPERCASSAHFRKRTLTKLRMFSYAEFIETQDITSKELTEQAIVAEGEDKITLFVWLLVISTSISGGLFGELLELFMSIREIDEETWFDRIRYWRHFWGSRYNWLRSWAFSTIFRTKGMPKSF